MCNKVALNNCLFKMSNQRELNAMHKRSEHPLKHLPTDVLLKARSTLGTLLKSRQEQPRAKPAKEPKDKRKGKEERLKVSRSEPEFGDMQKGRRSRMDDTPGKNSPALRPRPLSVGATKRYTYTDDIDDFPCATYPNDHSNQRTYDSTEEICVQSRLVIPVNNDRLNGSEVIEEKPRKKLSFREPEIEGAESATLGRSHKHMGVNSLSRRPQYHSAAAAPGRRSSLDGLHYDLESQAMRIVRTVGQAFEVCHKMQSEQHEAGASTSSVLDEPLPSDRASDQHAFKETPTECDASESGAASSRAPAELVSEEEPLRPKNLELLPPPPRKEGKRSPQPRPIPAATLELPECVTKAELSGPQTDEASTPLSAQHQLQLLRERLEQQAQQTRAAVAQLLLLRDQLAAEQAARCEAQTRTHQLLVHNKELLEHIAALVAHLQDRERGVTRPISAHQLTLLPQLARRGGGKDANSNGGFNGFNGAASPRHGDSLSDIIAQSNNLTQNLENNNVRISPGTTSLFDEPTTPVSFGDMTNEQIQNYLISKFQTTMPKTEPKPSVNYNQQFFQNSNAFPNIPPLTNHFSSTDVNSLLKHTAWSDGHGSQASSLAASKESTPERGEDGALFIMPLSHSGTLTAQSEDGRVKLIVPVSPSGSVADMAASPGTSASGGPSLRVPAYAPAASGNSLRVPGSTIQPGPITRTTSEKVPNRSEMMAALRSQWTRHTTK